MARPTRLLSEPIEIAPHDRAGKRKASSTAMNSPATMEVFHVPNVFFVASKGTDSTFEVIRSWGPERIETGWWRGRMIRRDYWRVEVDSGAQIWIFRDLRSGRWYVHGAF